jgi:DNA (cytosine-5)-methyltransferase 1
MRYLSVCSGIEAASVAFESLGWEAVGFSEIEPFPCAVLEQRFPGVQNFGDMTRYKEWDVGSVDILVGGTPCQSFSVAGLRKGLDDPRGNLVLVYCGLLERFKPKWFIWENVPGVLSSSGGWDFGSFLGAVVKLGYGFAYRVCDAQFYGVPQRRRRVFVVGYLGDWRPPAAVLFEPEGLRGNTKKGGGAGEEVARTLRGRANSSHREDSEAFVVAKSLMAKASRLDAETENFVACTLPASDGGVSSGMHPVVACGITIHGTDKTVSVASYTDVCGSLRARTPGGQENSSTTAVLQDMAVRRLTPKECERLQGFPDDWTLVQYRGKLACDSPRYKAIGNSMAVPVMRWIGSRLDAVRFL